MNKEKSLEELIEKYNFQNLTDGELEILKNMNYEQHGISSIVEQNYMIIG